MEPGVLTDSFYPPSVNMRIGKRTQEAYIAGGAFTLLVLLLLAVLACSCFACFRFWQGSHDERKELRRLRRERQLTDSPTLQRGAKYMPQIDASQEELNHECTSSTQTFFFPGQK